MTIRTETTRNVAIGATAALALGGAVAFAMNNMPSSDGSATVTTAVQEAPLAATPTDGPTITTMATPLPTQTPTVKVAAEQAGMTKTEIARSAVTYMLACGDTNPVREPATFAVTCGDNARTLSGLTWERWGTDSATAEGALTVAGATYPVEVKAANIMELEASARYATLQIHYQGATPAGFTDGETVRLERPQAGVTEGPSATSVPEPSTLAAPPAGKVVMAGCGGAPATASPTSLDLACDTERVELRNLTWTNWGSATAQATGTIGYYTGDVAPSLTYSVTVVASSLSTGADAAGYDRVMVKHTGDHPEEFPHEATYATS